MRPPRIAFVTPSYSGDLERCALLCESLDRMAQCGFEHYLLVADHDLPGFAGFASGRRIVVPDSELLPSWLKARRRPLDRDRWIWTSLSPPVWPMSGWHVQQLRKLALSRHIDADVMVMADSDSVFVRPFGAGAFLRDGAVRLYAKPNGIRLDDAEQGHSGWVRQAAAALGLPEPAFPATDYINNLVTWRRDHAAALLDRIEAPGGRHFAAVLGRSRSFSEYQLYGAYAEGIAGGSGHFADPHPLSLTYWSGEALDETRLCAFLADLSPQQIAVCVQSFTGTSTALLRRYLPSRDSERYVTVAETA